MNQPKTQVRPTADFSQALLKLADAAAIGVGLLLIVNQLPEFNSKSVSYTHLTLPTKA